MGFASLVAASMLNDDSGGLVRPGVGLHVQNQQGQIGVQRVVRMRCPGCHHNSRFEPVFGSADIAVELDGHGDCGLGIRLCPDESCGQLLFVVYYPGEIDSPLVFTAPPETLDFDSTDLPDGVLRSLQEAADCYSQGCYVASAIMLRRALEEVCAERKVKGSNLADRLESLRGVVMLPPELLDGLDSLRLLGNDAAHIESQTFNEVGRTEVELSFKVVKELLKGVYQYSALIGELNALKRAKPSPEPTGAPGADPT